MILSLITSGYSIDIILILLVAILTSATLSIVTHEVSHGYAALVNGDNTAKLAGRLTFNPLAHFDWVGFVLMILVGFGWAKPVPVNPYNFKNYKIGVIIVSLAGITANLLLAGIALLLLYFLYPFFISLMISASALRLLGFFFYYLLVYFVLLNIMLAFFNILPIAPLDGFNFLNALLPRGNAYSTFMFKYGWAILIAIIIVCNILNYVGLREYNVFYQVQQLAWRLIALVTGG